MELKIQCNVIYGIRCEESKERQYLFSRESIGPEPSRIVVFSVYDIKISYFQFR